MAIRPRNTKATRSPDSFLDLQIEAFWARGRFNPIKVYTGFSFSEKLEVAEVRANDPVAIDWTTGEYSAEGSLSMTYAGAMLLRESMAQASPQGIGLLEFAIGARFTKRTTGAVRHTINAPRCRVIEFSFDGSGSDGSIVEVPLKILKPIALNGTYLIKDA